MKFLTYTRNISLYLHLINVYIIIHGLFGRYPKKKRYNKDKEEFYSEEYICMYIYNICKIAILNFLSGRTHLFKSS